MLGTTKVRPLKKEIPEDLKKSGPSTFRDTVPRLLLWRRYEERTKNWKKRYKWALCTLESTERAIRREKVSLERDTDILAMTGNRIFGFPREVVEFTVREKSGERITMGAILYRLWAAHKGMEVRRRKGDRRNEFRWQLFADTHIDICTYMITYEAYDDSDLTDPDNSQTSDVFAARKEFYPSDVRFSYCGNSITPSLKTSPH